jgi:hypothetical protein
MSSCDPIISIYLKNDTGNKVKIIVKYENSYSMQLDSVICTNKPLDNYKIFRRDLFENKIPVQKDGKNEYIVEIESKTTILVEPRTMGRPPIKEIIYQSQLYCDTISELNLHKPLPDLASRYVIEKKGLYSHLIILK